MRLSVIAVAVASAGIAQVAATPIRIIIGSPHQEGGSPLDGVRLGHPVPLPPAVATWSVIPAERADGPAAGKRMRRPCHGRMSRISQKGIEISNTFRKALGLPLIETNPQPFINGGVVSGGFVPIRAEPIFHGMPTDLVPGIRYSSGPFPHHRHGHNGHRGRNGSFTARLNHSLMNLGRWEGRAVAFVLGCGIGVLLRMFWVLAIVTYRAIKGTREDESGYSHITIIEEYDEMPALTPPPTYIYPVDEKVAIEEEETPKAPVTSEESK